MVNGIIIFREYFKGFEDQYVLIGGAACDIVFENRKAEFRMTKDLDMVLIVEALTPEFGDRFWQFYRFDKPEADNYPRTIELFCRENFKLREMTGITPIHVNDSVSSL